MAETTTELGSGIDMSGFDSAVRAQDDLFSHVNGKWVAETEMPADKARWGTFDRLVENPDVEYACRPEFDELLSSFLLQAESSSAA